MANSNEEIQIVNYINIIEEEKIILNKLKKKLKVEIPVVVEISKLKGSLEVNNKVEAIVIDLHIVSLSLNGTINPNLDKDDAEILVNDIFTLISSLKNLQILNFSDNKISNIPDTIKNNQNLEKFVATNNAFQDFPSIICELKGLSFIDLSYNLIQNIPDQISKLNNLVELNLSNNQINNIHSNIYACRRLERLNLSGNRIQAIPDFFRLLVNLKTLKLSQNGMRDIDLSILKDMNKLEVIDLSKNHISKISSEMVSFIAGLDLFKDFNLAKNNFNETDIPDSLIHKIARQFDDSYLDRSERYILGFFKVFIENSELEIEIKDKHITNLNISFQDINFFHKISVI